MNLKNLLPFVTNTLFSIFLFLIFAKFFNTLFTPFIQDTVNIYSWNEANIFSYLKFSWSKAVLFSSILFTGYIIYKVRVRNILRDKEDAEKMYRNRTLELKQKNKDLIVAKKEMSEILENVKEGLFLINKEYKIESQYSSALEGILSKKDLAKTSFIDYFSNKLNKEEVNSIKDYLDILFDANVDESLINDLNPLSNTRLEFKYTEEDTITKYLTFEFGRIIQDGNIIKIIASVNDITEKLILEQNLELSRREVEQRTNRLQIILNIEPAMLKEFILSTKDELSVLNKIIKDKSNIDEQKLNELFRSIHVIKGNASLLGFSFFADHAHEIEDFITEIHKDKNYTTVSMYNLKCLIVGLNDLYHELKTLIERLNRFLEQFKTAKDENYIVLIKSLQKFVQKLATELNVNVKLRTDKFDNSLIPAKYRLILKDIIVQLVRNSMYHGIEKEAERLKKKKNKKAIIEISCWEADNGICIKVGDDGRGLQAEKLREKAIESGHWKKSEIEKWSAQKIYQSIFTPGISTASDISTVAGRGFGMDVIKNKLDILNGTIKIDSKEDHYTRFTLEVPLSVEINKKKTALAVLS